MAKPPEGIVVSQKLADRHEPKAPRDALNILHGCLRGRYPIVIILGSLIGAFGAFCGWRFARPLYRSEALLQIQYLPPRPDPNVSVIASTPFDVFMQSQQTLITSRRVVDRAMQDPAWQAVRGLNVPTLPSAFAANLNVITRPNQEYVRIDYSSSDPVVAAAAVRAVVTAYVEIYGFDDQQSRNRLLKIWSENGQQVGDRLNKTQTAIDQIVNEFGSSDLAPLHQGAVQRVAQLDAALQQIRLAMPPDMGVRLPPLPSTTATAATQPATADGGVAAPLTAEQIAVVDPLMQEYLADRRRAQDQLDSLRLRGFGDSWHEVIFAKNWLAQADKRVSAYAFEYNSTHEVSHDETRVTRPLVARTPAELRQEEQKILSLRDRAWNEMVRLEKARAQIEWRQANLRRDRDELDRINKMKDALEDQEEMGGRLTVINAGEVPLAPTSDNRLKLAAAAGLAGVSIPVGLFVIFGLLRRRYRYANETADISSNLPLLTILPALRERHSGRAQDTEERRGAAQHVHQIRVLLHQNNRSDATNCCYLVSSASAGEGKTSITVALALSFAAAGFRTLLIDGDVIGRQITRRLGVLDMPGLHESLRTGTLEGCLRQTAAGVAVLPVGQAESRDACAIPAVILRQLLSEARRYFDIILIDSGPILGSVEASILAQQVDEVLFVVSRGQQPARVEKAIRRLDALGATVRGAIFNRADTKDFLQSSYGSSSRSSSVPVTGGHSEQPGWRSSRFGPLVDAVVSSLPTDVLMSPQ